MPDETSGVIWLVIMIMQREKILYEIVEDRSLKTMEDLFKRNLLLHTTVITDSHKGNLVQRNR